MQPLSGRLVVDFSTLLPGPLATLILAEAGADVVKIERPTGGDELRGWPPRFGDIGVNFALLNRAKRSVAIDLKASDSAERLRPLLRRADVLVEQFRPGVMDRLGLGYEAVAAINPGIVYCSITGYGQNGPKAGIAGHDLDYLAETGLLGLTADADGSPTLPPALIADVGGGAYPAVINILLALQQRSATGQGCRLDISMTDNLFPFLFWAWGNAFVTGTQPTRGGEVFTGGSPRYRVYRTADDRFVAAAPLEDRFWHAFCDTIELPEALRDDSSNPQAVIAAVSERIRRRTAAEWRTAFSGRDACCAVVADLAEALADPHFRARGLFAHTLEGGGDEIPALPVPVAQGFRNPAPAAAPSLGEAAGLLGPEPPRNG